MFDEREKRLTCFLGYINNIDTYSFNIDDASQIKLNSTNTFSNNGAILLKTFSNKIEYYLNNYNYMKTESLVCFIDYYSEKSNCVKYNFQTNTFSEYIIYFSLNNCKSTSKHLFNIEKIDYHIFLYCFHS